MTVRRRTLWRLDMPPAVAAVLSAEDGVVTGAPRGWEWLNGWHVKRLAAYAKTHAASFTEIREGGDAVPRPAVDPHV